MTAQSATATTGDAPTFHGVQTRMSDGVALVCDIWTAGDDRPRPVVLERTPYGRSRTDQSERIAGQPHPRPRPEVARGYTAAGLTYVVQDCRGTGDSGGDFVKYTQEQADTSDTIAWILRQEWCDGRVAMAGFSYGAACQLAAIAGGGAQPCAAILDCGGFSDALSNGVRQGGALALKQATWTYAQAIRDARARGDAEGLQRLEAEDLEAWLRKGPWTPGHSPLAAAPGHEATLSELWTNSLDGPFWNRPGLRTERDRLRDTRTDILFVTSWFDTSLRGTLENHAAMCDGRSATDRPVLIVGPWAHGDRWTTMTGKVDMGDAALPDRAFGRSFPALRTAFLAGSLGLADRLPDLTPGTVHWFEISGRARPGGDTPRLTGAWRRAESWPPRDARVRDLFLSDTGLTETATEMQDAGIVSDPDDPTPTLGGAINSGGDLMPGGMFDQTPLDGGRDILRFETAAFDQDLLLAGPVTATIRASADAPDFDIAAKLLLVLEDGTPLNLSDGICRARHRNGVTTEELVPPGSPVVIPVELNPIAARVLPGQKLRLDLSGSNFPCFDVNPQTGAPQGVPGPRRRARITFHASAEHPSRLSLTVLAE